MRKKLITSDEAVPAKKQHKRPCSDCPWSKKSLPGWLGGLSAEEWLQVAHGDSPVPCHALKGAQCAGLAIYRANVGKAPREVECIRLDADRDAVFASPQKFTDHHGPNKRVRLLIGASVPNEHEDENDGEYIECIACMHRSAINIGGNEEKGWQWECTDCGEVFFSSVAPKSE